MIAIGLMAGILSGLLGIGGGILVIPALIYLYGMEQKLAQGTTLMMMLPPIGLFAAWEYFKRGEVNWQAGLLICGGFMLGGWIGAKYVAGLSPILLKRLFALLLIGMGVRMFMK